MLVTCIATTSTGQLVENIRLVSCRSFTFYTPLSAFNNLLMLKFIDFNQIIIRRSLREISSANPAERTSIVVKDKGKGSLAFRTAKILACSIQG